MTTPTPAALEALSARAADVRARYAAYIAQGLTLDMTRGKPGADQLDLADAMLASVAPGDAAHAGTDCRNYGGLEGLPEARALMAGVLDARPEQVLIGGNASLALMHDCVLFALLHGVPGGAGPWRDGPVKWICPVPGYDRHFKILVHLGIETITVPMGPDGPDMDAVEALVAADPAIKGLWLVPRYANPTGATCSDAVIGRLAAMKTAAPDFRIFNDDAYAVHHLVDEPTPRTPLLAAAEAAGNPDRVLTFGSTSKISFAGGGISAFAGSPANLAWLTRHRGFQTIGPDKLNQLRHVRFFKDAAGVEAHMKKHAAIIAPKFAAVLAALDAELVGLAEWTEPEGGYFVSVDVPEGLASRVVDLAAAAGVKLTPAGATFPHNADPHNRNIRLAPTLPPIAEVKLAAELFALCVKVAILDR
jgi:DNA-binding transcriptional MocR family regulator